MKLHELDVSMPVQSPHHRGVDPDAFEPHDAVYRIGFGRPLALQLESQFHENAAAASRSSTTIPTCAIRFTANAARR